MICLERTNKHGAHFCRHDQKTCNGLRAAICTTGELIRIAVRGKQKTITNKKRECHGRF